MTLSDGLGIVRYNSKILCKRHLLAGIVYAALLPLIYSFELLQLMEVVMVSEIPFSLLGALFLPAIVEVDFEDGIGEIISTKPMSKGWILLCRFGIGVLLLGIVTGVLLLYMVIQDSIFDFGRCYVSAMISQIYLGVVGMTIANLLRNVVAGYLTSFSYFFLEFITKGKYTGALYLFSLTKNDLSTKWWLMTITLGLVMVNVILLRRRNLH